MPAWKKTVRSVYQLVPGLLLALLLAACSDTPPLSPLPPDAVIVAFGDSLTRGTGASDDQAYPARLAEDLDRRVINAGVPGELSGAGLARLPQVLAEHRPALVILCHGGNDLLRRRPDTEAAANLRAMIEMIREQGAEVVLIGVPGPNLMLTVPEFYAELADEYQLPYAGDILPAVLGDRALKSDTVHPNAAGYDRLAAALAELIERAWSG
jgi:lysophospholipase L1-like esterase